MPYTATTRPNLPPLVADDVARTQAGSPVAIPVLRNDRDQRDPELENDLSRLDPGSVVIVGGPANGTTDVRSDGVVVYTPTGRFSGIDRFTYRVSDNEGLASTTAATVTVTVAPRAQDDALGAAQGETRVIDPLELLRNDLGSGLQIVAVGGATNGSVSRNAQGQIVFVGDESDTGGFSYTTRDSLGARSTAKVALAFEPEPPAPPVAVDDQAGLVARQVTTEIKAATLLANDRGDGLAIAALKGAVGATVELDAEGDVLLQASAAAGRAGRFTYTAIDRFGQTADAVVTFNVVPAPVARDDSLLAEAGKSRLIEPLDLLANDSGASLRVTRVLDSAGQALPLRADGSVLLAAASGGEIKLTYEIAGVGGTSRASVTLDVVAQPPARPGAVDDAFATCGDHALRLSATDLLANDTGSTLRLQEVGGARHGTVSRDGDTILFTPEKGFVGAASFGYTLADGLDRTDSALVRVNVTPPPVAVDDHAATLRDTALTIATRTLLADDVGVGLHLVSVGGAVNGNAVLSGSNVIFTPDAGFTGDASFTYRIEDASGCRDTAKVEVAVVPRPPTAPQAVDDQLHGCGDHDLVIAPATLTKNDSGVALDVTAVGSALNGTVKLSAGNVVFTPDDGFVGEARFTYRVTDGFGASDTARVLVDVTAPPDAVGDTRGVLKDTPLRFLASDLLANDSGDGLRVTAVSGAVNGTVRLDGKEVVFTPGAGFVGEARFSYRIADGDGCTDSARVTVDVRGPGDHERPVDALVLTDLARSFEPYLASTLPGVAATVADVVQATTPDGRFALASFIDQPARPFGAPTDHAYRAELPLDENRADLQAAIGELEIGRGGDPRMNQLGALVTALNDPALDFGADHARLVVLTSAHLFHFAGDGSGGSYPAIPDLARLLAAKDVSPIFAVSEDVLPDYERLVAQLGRGEAVPLAADGDQLAAAIEAELERSLGLPHGAADPLGGTGF